MPNWLITLCGIYFLSLYLSVAVANMAMGLLFLIAIYYWVKDFKSKKSIWLPKPLIISFTLLFLTVLISYYINPDLAGFRRSVFVFRWLLIVPLCAYLVSRDYEKIINLFKKISYVAIPFLGLVCLFQFLTGSTLIASSQPVSPNGSFYRAVGLAGPLTTSYSTAMLFVFFLVLVFNKAKTEAPNRFFNILAMVCAFSVAFTTLSRGPVISMVVASFLTLAFLNIRLSAIITVVLSIIPTVLIFFNDTFKTKFFNLILLKDTSVTWREKVLLVNWDMFLDHPFFGVGYGNPDNWLRKYYDMRGWLDFDFLRATSNNYLGFLSGLGAIGFLLFYFICFSFLKLSWDLYKNSKNQNYKTIAFAFFGAQICFHVSGLMEGIFFSTYPRHFIIAIWALVLGMWLSEKSKILQS